MPPAATVLPLINTDTSEQIQYESSNNPLYEVTLMGRSANNWGERTTTQGLVGKRAHRKNSESPSNNKRSINTIPTNKLFSAWNEKTQDILTDLSSSSLSEVIKISERYLLALQSSSDHRIFISSLLNVFRFSTNLDHTKVQQIIRTLQEYEDKSITKDTTIQFVRQLRKNGLTPSSVGSLNV